MWRQEGGMSMVAAGGRRKGLVARHSLFSEQGSNRSLCAAAPEDDARHSYRQSASECSQRLSPRSSLTPELLERMDKLRLGIDASGDASDALALSQQHDAISEFYTEEGIKQRAKLMGHPAIKHALECIWEAANGGEDAEFMSEADYMVMHRKMVLALEPMCSPKEAMVSALEDWRADTDSSPPGPHGDRVLDKGRFLWSWFELADLWTDSMDAESCAHPPPARAPTRHAHHRLHCQWTHHTVSPPSRATPRGVRSPNSAARGG
eukprot:6511232-Prymnesium_polylepis.2